MSESKGQKRTEEGENWQPAGEGEDGGEGGEEEQDLGIFITAV